MKDHYEILIVGGGTAGICVAARLLDREDPPEVAVIEPSEVHYYQPLWTLVGGGVFKKEITAKPEARCMPPGTHWIQDRVAGFDPENKKVTLAGGQVVGYDQLVVAAGIQIDWDKVEGLKEALGKNGVCSNYSYETVEGTWKAIQQVKDGKAIFTHPGTPIKCGGAPQKIMYLAEETFRRRGVREKVTVSFYKAGPGIFAVKKYADALQRIVEARGIETPYRRELRAVKGEAREAVFENLDSGETEVVPFSMLHVTPPMSAPDFLKASGLGNEGGWVDVDKYTTQHVKYPDVFALGDASSLPTSKTGAAIRKQAPVTVENLLAHRAGRPLEARYDGYTSCPLVTGYGKLILAEFDYDGNPLETFPFDQAEERYSMYALKAYALPEAYWHGMLKGRI